MAASRIDPIVTILSENADLVAGRYGQACRRVPVPTRRWHSDIGNGQKSALRANTTITRTISALGLVHQVHRLAWEPTFSMAAPSIDPVLALFHKQNPDLLAGRYGKACRVVPSPTRRWHNNVGDGHSLQIQRELRDSTSTVCILGSICDRRSCRAHCRFWKPTLPVAAPCPEPIWIRFLPLQDPHLIASHHIAQTRRRLPIPARRWHSHVHERHGPEPSMAIISARGCAAGRQRGSSAHLVLLLHHLLLLSSHRWCRRHWLQFLLRLC
mmetsp:Transcript_112946/g.241087  ORF Transcript_112946/g.241087 Transcript_112946/m.241087 type:complete len:269 (+) Transcript_112946:231-1037(+)